MHVTTPVLGQHHRVLDLVDAAEELPLVVGQRRLRVIVFGPGPGVAHLGHVVLPGQAFGKALGVEGDLQLGHRVSPLLVFDYGPLLYTKALGRDSDAPARNVLTSRPTVCGTRSDGKGKESAETTGLSRRKRPISQGSRCGIPVAGSPGGVLRAAFQRAELRKGEAGHEDR